MYNEDRKMAFLATRPEHIFRIIFAGTERYEVRYGLDLCELPVVVMQEIIDNEFGFKYDYKTEIVMRCKHYHKWCIDQGYHTSNSLYEIQEPDYRILRKYMVSSPKHLQSYLEKAFDPLQKKSTHCLYRCAVWLEYIGLPDIAICDIKSEDIDLSSLMIDYKGVTYEIPQVALPCFRVVKEAEEFYYEHPLYKDKAGMKRRKKSPYLFRGIKSEQPKTTGIFQLAHELITEAGLNTSQSSIQLSGIFYRAFELEQCGVEPNFVDEVVTKHQRDWDKLKDPRRAIAKFNRVMRIDYRRWKKAFFSGDDT